jgi:hypothetical protein
MAKPIGNARQLRGGISAVALLVAVLAAGCAVNSEVINVWHDASLPAGSIHNLLVVAIRKDPVRRRAWEDAFVTGLAARGVTATSSYRLYPDAPPDTEQVIEAVRKNGYGAVLTSIRLPNEATSTYIPGTVRQQRVSSEDYYGRFHSYWVTVQDPGYTETDNIIQVQTDVWVVTPGGGRLVSSNTLRTLESMTGRTVDKAVSREILPELERQGMVPARAR